MDTPRPPLNRDALIATLLDDAASAERPLDTLMTFVDELLTVARNRFAHQPAASVAWSEDEQVWLLNRAAAVLEQDLTRYPWHRYTVALYLDRPGEDSDYLEALEIRAPTHTSAINAALALSAFVLGASATVIEEDRR